MEFVGLGAILFAWLVWELASKYKLVSKKINDTDETHYYFEKKIEEKKKNI